MAKGSHCRLGVVAVATGLLCGCAAPAGPSWANFKSDKAVNQAAADDNFPSAAQVGLASTDVRSSKTR